jgi:putative oxidoreductase
MPNLAKLILRVSLGTLILLHGIFKLTHGIDHIKHIFITHHIPAILAYSIYLVELVGALFLIIGWQSRIWASLIAIEMLCVIYLTKLSIITHLSTNGALSIEREVLFFALALAVALLGSGRFGVDRG